MTLGGSLGPMIAAGILMSIAARGPGAGAAVLIEDGGFEACTSGKLLRQDNKGQDWYESRKDGKEGRGLLKLSTKDIGGNKTHKAIIVGHAERNTYLSQRFATEQEGDFAVQFDIYVKEILPDDNRSAFFLIGSDKDKKRGPNSTGTERFVFMGFENAKEKGKINLFARQKNATWEEKTIIARGLELHRWYTIDVRIHVQDEAYEVSVKGVTEPMALDAFSPKGKPLKRLTHLSFASWDDGAGTFYVDNVLAN